MERLSCERDKELKIRNTNHRKIRKGDWTEEELKTLQENYEHMTITKLRENFLSSRTYSSIMSKANKLGLQSRKKWSEAENEIMKKYYHKLLNNELKKLYLPNRSTSAIQDQAKKLNLIKINARKEYCEVDLLKFLVEYSKEIGRTPSGDDIRSNPSIPSLSTYVRYFGNYSIACREAGLDINCLRLFGKKSWHYASNGDLCLSKAELSVTEYLISNNIKYTKEYPYNQIVSDEKVKFKRCDWYLDSGIIIEYFGMPEKPYYKKKMDIKIQVCKDNNIPLIQLLRGDLRNLDIKLKPLTKQNPERLYANSLMRVKETV
ncbi:homing endonuclease associated repeat-containing protein [Paenibacillus sp. GCM10027627]|uniref:homing endonuclease associated repeat-containing protein n=1 Tax=unclassified Paenibacillus TaxID=185978 RepID=UPI0036360D24